MSTNTTVVNQWIRRLPIAMILLAAALTLGFVLANLQPVARLSIAGTGNNSGVQRGIEAYAARYTAMAESYAARSESVSPGINADIARYTAMAAYYEALKESNLRHIEAYAARYNAMAEFYAGK